MSHLPRKLIIMTVLLKNLFTVHILIWHTQIRSQLYLWWQNSAFMDTARRSATGALLHRCRGEEQRWIYIPIRCPWMQFEQVPPTPPKNTPLLFWLPCVMKHNKSLMQYTKGNIVCCSCVRWLDRLDSINHSTVHSDWLLLLFWWLLSIDTVETVNTYFTFCCRLDRQ